MRYRKKPVEVDAHQITADILNGWYQDLPPWLFHHPMLRASRFDKEMSIITLEGEMKVSENDWIIMGVQGEIYPCKPDIFEQTYEPVDEIAEATGRRHGE